METRDLGQLAYLDRRFHDPERLAVLTALSACEQADLLFLQRITGLTEGKLSSSLSKLARTGLVEIEERFLETQSLVRLSDAGRQRIETYWAAEEASPRAPGPPAPTRGHADAVPGPGTAEGKATRFGFTVYQGGRIKRRDR